ncbi:WG repeat-containing protein [Bacteroides sp. 519]|uniref:WG repeat-containing protein n=1 Tax=Bacteroides sp. 519 TaxID=2302937 RepID=UPI0013D525B5|nr:WG repeat-containing protein [Bacteroides sp. 519]NDV60638.1 WG repeat-containing protein [Bacteroides sp. 519]
MKKHILSKGIFLLFLSLFMPLSLLAQKYNNKLDSIYTSVQMTPAATLIVGKDKKYGLMDETGNLLLAPLIYDDIKPNELNLLTAIQNGKIGILSVQTGRVIQPCVYDSLCFQVETLEVTDILAKKNGKWGITTVDYQHFKELLPCEYDNLTYLETDRYIHTYRIKKNNKYGLYNEYNQTPLVYDSIVLMNSIEYGISYFKVTRNGKEGIVSSTEFEEIILCVFDKLTMDKNMIVKGLRNGKEISFRLMMGEIYLL